MIIKCYKDNILIGIKSDKDGDYLYVATMHEVQESKIVRRLHSGRIKEVITECESTVHIPLSREVFWHEYAKIPRHTSQNSIAAGNLE